jgi:hypothetical protein
MNELLNSLWSPTFEARPYEHPMEHLSDELLRLDLILDIEMRRLNAAFEQDPALETFRGMYMTELEAKTLLGRKHLHLSLSPEEEVVLRTLEERIASRVTSSEEAGIRIPLAQLQRSFQLFDLDIRMLIVAIAPHVDRKYLKLFAYLLDDMTCQYVTQDLLLRLSCKNEEERRHALRRLNGDSHGVGVFLMKQETAGFAQGSSLLTAPVRLDDRIVHYILGLDWPYEGALSSCRFYDSVGYESLPPLWIHQREQEQMQQYSKQQLARGEALAWVLNGPSGSGKTFHARHLCGSLGRGLLEWDGSHVPEEWEAFIDAVNRVRLEAKLRNAILAFDRIHMLGKRLPWLFDQLKDWDGIVFLFSEEECKPHVVQQSMKWLNMTLLMPDIGERHELWKCMSEGIIPITESEASMLAGKFRFTPGKILETVTETRKLEGWRKLASEDHQPQPANSRLLHQTAYRLTDHQLKNKAVKMETRFGWDDLVLPNETTQLLKQACNRLLHRTKVMVQWGFEKKLAYGKGISMLFTGPPGTGKTMSAMVMAREMDAELYRIDLSRVVSKYIGETEKNLGDIFDQAALSGAILFFDEADALFGKRSEVKDAHDKYANMETSYLLQKMEEYDGLTILATNFGQNLDDAFMRRIQFIIKYPFPDAAQREQLWRSSFPAQLPMEEIDYAYLAQTFELAGGSIKNIVLTASFLAASEGASVSMKHLVEGVIQEYKKTGKLLLKDRLGAYADYWKG